ncbi:MAG: UvrD-helicase domain-containing protein, partial [Eggerthellaceae bacterium]|nr:UvrD-helicase domain-containing protein [Eggerthellaceae bacterium]
KDDAGFLDNDDLLRRTIEAFKTHPDIAKKFGSKFKLVMVDEFQDTSRLQIDMIECLAGEDCVRLCTVGDSQQSIYRFRGADVNVYNRHKKDMREKYDATECELTVNYRSHKDVLSFVRKVFANDCMFGDGFMDLEAFPKRKDTYKASMPRINMCVVTPAAASIKVKKEELKSASASCIAEKFEQLHLQGQAYGDMVVLLGRMTNASLFADALRQRNIPCVVAGGSQFAGVSEVFIIGNLLAALANPYDGMALFCVLQSEMFGISPQELLLMASRVTLLDETSNRYATTRLGHTFRAMVSIMHQEGTDGLKKAFLTLVGQEPTARLICAIATFEQAWYGSQNLDVSDVVKNCVAQSGWMKRLEKKGVEGVACAANVMKALRKVKLVQDKDGGAFAQTASAFASYIASIPREAPGALNTSAGDAVRIMTIHSSKGLEFGVVAVAEFETNPPRSTLLVSERIEEKCRVSLAFDSKYPDDASPFEWLPVAKKGAGCIPEEEYDISFESFERYGQFDYRRAIKQQRDYEEAEETKRLFYVALTRAKESLVVAVEAPKWNKDNDIPSYDAIGDALRCVFCKEGDFPKEDTEIEYGGTRKLSFKRVLLGGANQNVEPLSEREEIVDEALFVPDTFFVNPSLSRQPSPIRFDVFSYSAISHTPEDTAEEEQRHKDDYEREITVFADESGVDEVAVNFGSAFHKACELETTRNEALSSDQIKRIVAQYKLTQSQANKLEAAYRRWVASDVRKEAMNRTVRIAEMPFEVKVAGEFIEGEMDLICFDKPVKENTDVLIVDYKTGGSDDETPDALRKKHELQAKCYAYASLLQGASCVELRFVRVERCDTQKPLPGGGYQPQVVSYRYTKDDCEALAQSIEQARRSAKG